MSVLTLYLAGPINGRSDADCIDWRKEAARLWPGEVLDPMRRDYRGAEAANVDKIIDGDKEDIRKSDAMLVMFDRPSVGTSMEIMYAFMFGIPVVVVDVSNAPLSPWLRYHADAVTDDLAVAIDYLRRYL